MPCQHRWKTDGNNARRTGVHDLHRRPWPGCRASALKILKKTGGEEINEYQELMSTLDLQTPPFNNQGLQNNVEENQSIDN